MFSTNKEERLLATKQWNEARKQYEQYLEQTVRHNVPRTTWETIVQCHDFHDYIIDQFLIDNVVDKNGRHSIIFKMVLDGEIVLVLENVTSCSCEIHNQEAFPDGSFAWGYCEFELVDNKIKLSIICDVTNTLMFVFNNLAIQKWTKPTTKKRSFFESLKWSGAKK